MINSERRKHPSARTFEELCQAIIWPQLGLHRKLRDILNVDGFFDPLLALFDGAARSGFISDDNRRIVFATDNPRTLLDHLASPLDPTGAVRLRPTEQS